MKKRITALVLMTVFASVTYGSYIEIKGSYFVPSEEMFREVHGNGVSFGVEMSVTVWNGFVFWAGGDYFSDKGKLTFSEEETEIRIIPLYGGVKYIFSMSTFRPYLGLGIGYFMYKETNYIGTVEEGGLGYIAQAGGALRVTDSLFIDIQGSYSYCKVKPGEVEADLGGLRIGIGFGFKF